MITAGSNSRIKELIQLNQKAKVRREKDLFVVEGIKMFMEAPLSMIQEVFVSESFWEKIQQERENIKTKLNKCHMEMTSDQVFEKVTDTKTPQGILCVMKQFHYAIEEILTKGAPFLMLLEDLQDPGNLGTILRTGEGAGITGVIMTQNTVDIYNPKTIRATMGSIYRVPFVYTQDIGATIGELEKRNITVYAAHLQGEADYDVFDYREGSAFMIGNEGNGLRKETAALAGQYIKIPMLGQVESLNAASAASVLMYEAAKQRR